MSKRWDSSKRVPRGRLPLLKLVQKPGERKEFAIARARTAEIAHDPRHVIQVRALAVAMIEPREDAKHLELALHAHPLEITPERGEIGGDRQGGVARTLPASRRPVELPLLVPLAVCVAIQFRRALLVERVEVHARPEVGGE